MSIDQVVCICDDWGPHANCAPNRPILGGIYTIRCVSGMHPITKWRYYIFEELINPKHPKPDFLELGGGGEPMFCCEHFRQVRKTDISKITRHSRKVRELT